VRIARLLGALVATTALVALAAPAGAGAVVLTVEIDPTSGGPGTEIAVTGTCLDGGMECNATGTVINIVLLDATAAVVATSSTETEDAAGNYDTVIVVPGTATVGTYTVRAEAVDSSDTVVAETETAFTVPEPASTMPPVDVVPAPEPAAPEATAPAPVPARPRFTG
jgi:hypothetical protein